MERRTRRATPRLPSLRVFRGFRALGVLVGLAGVASASSVSAAALAQEHTQEEGHGPAHAAPHRGAHAEDRGGIAEAEADAKHEGAGTEEQHGAPKPINWLDFSNKEQPPYAAMFLNFVLLIAMYVWLGKKPISAALKSRRAAVAKEIEEAQRMRREAEERALVYQKKLEHLEEELKETRASLVDAGKSDRDRIIREAEEKAQRMEKDAIFMIEQEMKQLRVDLMREAVGVAVATAEELLRKRVTPVDQERLADDYLADLTAKNKSSSGSMPPSGRPSGSFASAAIPPVVPPAPQAVSPERGPS